MGAGGLSSRPPVLSELLFECYSVPSVLYGVDAAFSYYQNNGGNMDKEGLIVSSGHNATYVLPIYDHRLQANQSKRWVASGSSRGEGDKLIAHADLASTTTTQNFLGRHSYQ